MVTSVDQDKTAPIGAVCSGSTPFASILNLSVMLDNYLQQTTSTDDIFRCIFFLAALRVKINCPIKVIQVKNTEFSCIKMLICCIYPTNKC